MKKEFIIGILGGMGTYATIHVFQQYADLFPAEKEWDRPRIIIDNRCTMPSRVRAVLYKENIEVLVSEMTESLKMLMDSGCNRIILACNTSHIFLPLVYQNLPNLESVVLHIIENCADQIVQDDIQEVYLLASEGTIESGIYQEFLMDRGFNGCITPKENEYSMLRTCIEAVKQNKYSEDIRNMFLSLINRYENCILGCTELPILYAMYKAGVQNKRVYDPVQLGLERIKREYNEWLES